MFRWTILCFSWCPSPLIFSLSTNEKSLASSSFATSLQVFVHINEILPEPFLLQAAEFTCSAFHDVTNTLDPSLALWPFTGLAPVVPSPLFRGVWNWTQYSRCGPASAEWKEHFLQTAVHSSSCSPRYHFAFLLVKAVCWPLSSLVSTSTPSPSCKAAFQLVCCSMCWSSSWCGAVPSYMQDFPFTFIELRELLNCMSDHFFGLFRFLWLA